MINGWIRVLGSGGRLVGAPLLLGKRRVAGGEGTLFATGWDAAVGVGGGGC
jgi:hypothetical protein